MNKRMTTEIFIEKAKAVHGDKYDYSLVEYKNPKTKVKIICPIHGEFEQKPYNHLNGQGCSKCRYEMLGDKFRKPNEEFIEELKKVHGDRYDYSKVKYKTWMDKITIICPKHGEFEQAAFAHLHGSGCPKCAHESKIGYFTLSNEEFIERARKIHGDRYIYTKVEYKTYDEKVCIICPKHGEFWQTPDVHLQGKGCPKCNRSRLEARTSLLLSRNNIEFEEQKKFPWLKNYELDFYLPKHNIAIECQGIQHFETVDLFGGEEQFKKQNEWDDEKLRLCEEHGVKMIYLTTKSLKDKFKDSYKHELISENNELLEKLI